MLKKPDNAQLAPFATTTIGGTFHALHIGHKRYMEIAFTVAHWIYIHITTDEFASSLKKYNVKPYDVRREQIESFLRQLGWLHRAEIRSLGSQEELRNFCLSTDLSVAVVEPAYFDQFKKFNQERLSHGMEEYCILMKPRTKIGSSDISSHALEPSAPD